MQRSSFPDLRTMLIAVAIVEAAYAATGLLTPPQFVLPVTGWVLSPDGQWLTKLLGAALGFQAYVAWALRNDPHLGIVKALAAYQIVAATIDWLMWLALAADGIFSTPLARFTVGGSVVLHYAIGLLLIAAIRNHRNTRATMP